MQMMKCLYWHTLIPLFRFLKKVPKHNEGCNPTQQVFLPPSEQSMLE